MSWKPTGATIKPIEDFWNDKIDYSCTTFEDVCRLNKELLRVAVKYRLLGGSAEATEVIEMILRNLECLQVFLGNLEENVQDQPSKFIDLNQKIETINKLLSDISPSLHKCELPADRLPLVRCVFQNNWDQNGVLYWLGTNRITTEWKNPYPQFVNVTCFPPEELYGNLSSFVDRTGSQNYLPRSNAIKNGSFTVDLLSVKVVPTHYTLRDSTNGNYQLRNWNLEGSNDGKTWIILKNHVNDASIAKQGDTHSWKIDFQVEAFQMFRVQVTGPWRPGYFFLFCSGFEIYGDVYHLD